MLVKIIVTDIYLSFKHGLYNGVKIDAKEVLTSTKKLKGYEVSSLKTGVKIYLDVHEIEKL